ncbi:MAG: DMT family transporter [Rhodospirillales bacterium]
MALSGNQKGLLWISSSVLGATGMSLCVRGLGGLVPVVEIVTVRCAIGLVVFGAAVMWRKSGPVWNERWRWHAARGGLTIAALYFGYYSLTHLPMATATVLFFTAPLWVTVFSIPIFGETPGWRRTLAMATGFIGVIIVLRPATAGFDPLLLIPLGSSLCFSLVLLIGKHLSKSDPPEIMMVYAMTMALIATAPFTAYAWVTPDLFAWALLIGVSLFGMVRGYSDIQAYANGEPSILVPIQYTRLVFVAIGAFIFFQEVPDAYTVAGAAVIVAATLYIARRESLLAKEGRIKKAAGGAGP